MIEWIAVFVLVWRALLETYKTFFRTAEGGTRDEPIRKWTKLVQWLKHKKQEVKERDPVPHNFWEPFVFAFIGSLAVTCLIGFAFFADPPPAFSGVSYITSMVWVIGGALVSAGLTIIWQRDRSPRAMVIGGLQTAGTPLMFLVLPFVGVIIVLFLVHFW